MLKKILVSTAFIVVSHTLAMQRGVSPCVFRTSSSPELARATAGWLFTVSGPMFSGKSEELISRIITAKHGGLEVVVIKPGTDTRTMSTVKSRAREEEIKAISVDADNPEIVLEHVATKKAQVLAMDESQFFNYKMVPVVQTLLDQGLQVWAAGLDKDFKKEPFGTCMPELIARSDDAMKRFAVCAVCKSFYATVTQRLIDGRPARRSDPVIIVDNGTQRETYEPRCRACHVLPKD